MIAPAVDKPSRAPFAFCMLGRKQGAPSWQRIRYSRKMPVSESHHPRESSIIEIEPGRVVVILPDSGSATISMTLESVIDRLTGKRELVQSKIDSPGQPGPKGDRLRQLDAFPPRTYRLADAALGADAPVVKRTLDVLFRIVFGSLGEQRSDGSQSHDWPLAANAFLTPVNSAAAIVA